MHAARHIAPEDLVRLVSSGRRVVVIDVRDPAEIERSHKRFPGALEVPENQLFVRRQKLPIESAETIVTISNKGDRADAAAFTLSLLGCADARALEGGLEGLTKKHFPLS